MENWLEQYLKALAGGAPAAPADASRVAKKAPLAAPKPTQGIRAAQGPMPKAMTRAQRAYAAVDDFLTGRGRPQPAPLTMADGREPGVLDQVAHMGASLFSPGAQLAALNPAESARAGYAAAQMLPQHPIAAGLMSAAALLPAKPEGGLLDIVPERWVGVNEGRGMARVPMLRATHDAEQALTAFQSELGQRYPYHLWLRGKTPATAEEMAKLDALQQAYDDALAANRKVGLPPTALGDSVATSAARGLFSGMEEKAGAPDLTQASTHGILSGVLSPEQSMAKMVNGVRVVTPEEAQAMGYVKGYRGARTDAPFNDASVWVTNHEPAARMYAADIPDGGAVHEVWYDPKGAETHDMHRLTELPEDEFTRRFQPDDSGAPQVLGIYNNADNPAGARGVQFAHLPKDKVVLVERPAAKAPRTAKAPQAAPAEPHSLAVLRQQVAKAEEDVRVRPWMKNAAADLEFWRAELAKEEARHARPPSVPRTRTALGDSVATSAARGLFSGMEEKAAPQTKRLFRGDATPIESFDVGRTDTGNLFGQGIYLTDSPRIAGDYRSKGGAAAEELFRYDGGTKATKQDAVDTYIRRRLALTVDADGKRIAHPAGLDLPHSGPEREARLAHARRLWDEMQHEVDVRKLGTGEVVIQKKGAGALSHVEVPADLLDRTVDAEAPISRDIAATMHEALLAHRDRGTANDLWQFATTPNEMGEAPTFREVWSRFAGGVTGPEGFSTAERQATLRQKLQELGLVGVRYDGGATMGGAKHQAYSLWDAAPINAGRKATKRQPK